MNDMILILNFNGYWLEENKDGLPEVQGIYLVYTCLYEKTTDKVVLKKLIYIGQAQNVRERILGHEKNELFKSECLQDETICYSYAEIRDDSELNMAENALIFAEKPKLNTELKDSFNYDNPIDVIIKGDCFLLKHTEYSIK